MVEKRRAGPVKAGVRKTLAALTKRGLLGDEQAGLCATLEALAQKIDEAETAPEAAPAAKLLLAALERLTSGPATALEVELARLSAPVRDATHAR